MYEEYLENFVFKTAKLIATKLFGRARKSKNPAGDETKNDETKSEESKDIETKDENNEQALQAIEEPIGNERTEEDIEIDRELEEAMIKQREERSKKDKESLAAREEYDAITDGLSEINFHLPLFFLLLLLTMLSLPSVVTWAKNYQYSRVLTPDPTLIPAICVLSALGVIWQLPTPRNL